ncbi:DUF4278 domain-containing protein [Oscillatoriales cyanobacterium LEGE 11467]|uniref:DUF4278 domain-containing protein n=1 Tax=Zarconia navalis LEGE 11467 TaxID=1828826 RepID=A0A928VWQ7_9CYAN|nr:DUF4278 domain-containing protein [Zarconia navalis]MBE9041719.1 DUF4278 domain-containing protein [Zarconia navalis LEGE 11467]
MSKIQLSYRGVPYTRTSSSVAFTPSRQGKYRGRQWSVQSLEEGFAVASTAPLKYRGVEYFGAVRPYALSGLIDRSWVDFAPTDDLWLILSTSG